MKSVATFLFSLALALLPAWAGAGERLSFNPDWRFLRLDETPKTIDLSPAATDYDDSLWETVVLPHTPRIEARKVARHFQGIAWYRKTLRPDPAWRGRKLFLEFEAAMQVARVWVNGEEVITHEGGYLPFTIDLSDRLDFQGPNLIAVMLDNRDNPEVPPGKPLAGLDFSYFGGLYHNVWLVLTDRLHITDPILEDEVAGGGIMVRSQNVGPNSAQVIVKVHVRNDYPTGRRVQILATLLDPDGQLVGQLETFLDLDPNAAAYAEGSLTVPRPRLWSPDLPSLYSLQVQLFHDHQLADQQTLAIGIRDLAFTPQGFFINGQPLWLYGTNRHQEFPYLGGAASDNAQWRDAVKLKRAGFNLVRMAHYPQSPAFIAACDRLGLMLIEPTPGWQFWNNRPRFKQNVERDVRRMIRRDRNHPSVILWEVALNETSAAPDAFYHQLHLAAHQELPGDQTFTCGDTDGRKNPIAVGFDVPFAEWREKTFTRGLWSVPDKLGYAREYGDYEFGGNHSTSRAFIGDGEAALLLQAWNFQWSLNRNAAQPSLLGAGNWVAIDHNRGGFPSIPVSAPGALDQFRLPKFVYFFFMSQRDPARDWAGEPGPMIFIANYWTHRASPAKIVIYSNCEQVELFQNGRSLGRANPDRGPDTDYVGAASADPNYWSAKNWLIAIKDWVARRKGPRHADPESVKAFDGGNCLQLAHPPFTFTDVDYEPGELRAVGYIGGKPAAETARLTPGPPARLELSADLSGRPLAADGADFVFVYARVLDDQGVVVPDAEVEVAFEAAGPGRLVGENPVIAEVGVASILLQSTLRPGNIALTATAPGLAPAQLLISTALAGGDQSRKSMTSFWPE